MPAAALALALLREPINFGPTVEAAAAAVEGVVRYEVGAVQVESKLTLSLKAPGFNP